MPKKIVKYFSCMTMTLCLLSNVAFAEKDAKTERGNKEYVLKVSKVSIESEKNDDKEVKRLLPELFRKEVRVSHLSKNIQQINDLGAMQLKVQFQPEDDGTYTAMVKVGKGKRDRYTFGVNNTGNDYTGNWRAIASYSNFDLTKNGDVLNIAYVTSPNHLNDVHQAMVSYKAFLPRLGDSLTFNYGYSDSDMGQIADIGGFGLFANGMSRNAGIHYQHNFKYTNARKQILDIGYDYKKSDGHHEIRFLGNTWAVGGYGVDENLLSITYYDIARSNKDALSYNVGYIQNLKGYGNEYNNYRTGADSMFRIFKAGVNYQRLLEKDWMVMARLDGQLTSNNLLNMDQLGAGGTSTVRGFKEGAASGDKGYIASLEFYSPKVAPNQRFVLFGDVGCLYNNNYNIGETKKKLSSWGIGYRYADKHGLSINIDYAKVMSHKGVGETYRLPWHFSIMKSF